MYAVIRAGGKQYRVAPGDVIRVEKLNGTDDQVEFPVVAVSGEEGQVGPQSDARVVGEVVGDQGRNVRLGLQVPPLTGPTAGVHQHNSTV